MRRGLLLMILICLGAALYSQPSLPGWLVGRWAIQTSGNKTFQEWVQSDSVLVGRTYGRFHGDVIVFDTKKIYRKDNSLCLEMLVDTDVKPFVATYFLTFCNDEMCVFENHNISNPFRINFLHWDKTSIYVWTESSTSEACTDFLMTLDGKE